MHPLTKEKLDIEKLADQFRNVKYQRDIIERLLENPPEKVREGDDVEDRDDAMVYGPGQFEEFLFETEVKKSGAVYIESCYPGAEKTPLEKEIL